MGDAMSVALEATAKVGFLTRALALIIDAVLLGIVGAILSGMLFADGTRTNGFILLLDLVYFGYFWSGQGHGQTLGMRALNIRVVRTDGSDLTVSQAVIRYVGLVISFLVIFLGVIWVAFDAQKQGWHDKIARTYVVKVG
jgi:uncharacterized RDD family membrane protein YckC